MGSFVFFVWIAKFHILRLALSGQADAAPRLAGSAPGWDCARKWGVLCSLFGLRSFTFSDWLCWSKRTQLTAWRGVRRGGTARVNGEFCVLCLDCEVSHSQIGLSRGKRTQHVRGAMNGLRLRSGALLSYLPRHPPHPCSVDSESRLAEAESACLSVPPRLHAAFVHAPPRLSRR